jgi:hypothetical protein
MHYFCIVVTFKIINFNIDYIINIDIFLLKSTFFFILSLDSGNMNQ